MSDKTHVVESRWRETDAAALEARVETLSEWLDHTEDLVEMFDGDEALASQLRGLSGLVRTRRSDISNEAGKIRADILGREGR